MDEIEEASVCLGVKSLFVPSNWQGELKNEAVVWCLVIKHLELFEWKSITQFKKSVFYQKFQLCFIKIL